MSCAAPSATSSRTAGSTCRRRSCASSTGCRRASTAGSACRSGKQTERVERALRSGYVSCLSHPKGRYINRRPENELDIDRLIEVALEEDVALEVNGLPDRLDLKDVYVRQAVEAGAKLVCSTDAHSIRGLSNMELSVATARRGWATAGDVLNTLPVDSLLGRRALRR